MIPGATFLNEIDPLYVIIYVVFMMSLLVVYLIKKNKEEE